MKIAINKCYLVSVPHPSVDVAKLTLKLNVLQDEFDRLTMQKAGMSRLLGDIYNDETCRELAPALFERLHAYMSR
jgi:hypothetical protein